MTPHRWLRMLHRRQPPLTPLRELSAGDSDSGVRLLAEGLFKYLPFTQHSHFFDRLLFIHAMHPLIAGRVQAVKQVDAPPSLPPDIYYTIPINKDIEPFLRKHYMRLQREEQEKKLHELVKGKSEWWGTIPSPSLIELDSLRFPKNRLNKHLMQAFRPQARSYSAKTKML